MRYCIKFHYARDLIIAEGEFKVVADDVRMALQTIESDLDVLSFVKVDSVTPLPEPERVEERGLCGFCGKPFSEHPRCPRCGYTPCDEQIHGDHHLCESKVKEDGE